ncbi:MAG: hypothetical protein U0269_25775 [Polyangiales bacterium]
MSEQRRALATREGRDSPGISLGSKAMATLSERCPACGVERDERRPCPRCAHQSDRSRWRSWRREKRSILRATWGSASGEYALIGALLFGVAIAMLRSELARSSVLFCAATAVLLLSLPLIVTGFQKALRVASKRRWRYDGPDGVVCIADGTPWAIEATIRIRPIATAECRAPSELQQIEPGHAQALAERPEVLAGMRYLSKAPLKGVTRERAEACIAVAIAIARMEIEGAVRLVRSELLRTSRVLDREAIEEKRVVFGVAARFAPQARALGAWVFQALPKDQEDRERAHYRATTSAADALSAGRLAELEAALVRLFRGEAMGGATGAIRTKINAEGGWHSSAPSLTMESQQWLAELAGCVWDALRTAEQTDDDDR